MIKHEHIIFYMRSLSYSKVEEGENMKTKDIIEQKLKEFRKRFVQSSFQGDADAYFVQCDAQDLEHFIRDFAHSLLQNIGEEVEGMYKDREAPTHHHIGYIYTGYNSALSDLRATLKEMEGGVV